MSSKARPLGVAAVLALALVLRLVVIADSPGFNPQSDATDYDRIATSLADTGSFPTTGLASAGGPTAFRPPAFPLLLAATYSVSATTGNPPARWQAGRVLEAGLGTLTVLLVILVGLELWDWRAALVAGAVAAVDPPLMLAGSSLLSESLFLPLVLAAVLAALRARRSARPIVWALAAGALTGASALTRSNGFVVLLPLCLLLWPAPRRNRRSLRGPGAAVLAALLICLPWTLRNLSTFHELVPVSTEAGYALDGTYNAISQSNSRAPAMWVYPVPDEAAIVRAHPHLDEAQLSDRLTSAALEYLRAHPVALARTAVWSSLRLLNLTGVGMERSLARYEAYPLWLTDVSVYAFWVQLAAIALAVVAGGLRRAPLALWLVPALLLLSSVPFIGATRYRVPADPFFILLIVGGMMTLLTRRHFGGSAVRRYHRAAHGHPGADPIARHS